ncbi:MAG: hypothetical protein ACYCYR_05775 [Desulfobulbaceae bacterium]
MDDSPRAIWLYGFCCLYMALVLYLDLRIPLGVAMGVPYIVAVLVALRVPGMAFAITVATLASILTIGALLYKPPVDEMWKAVVNRAIALFVIWATAMLGMQQKITEEKRKKAVEEREKALAQVKILRGLLPICASCKKVRDDQGYWSQIETYIHEHSEAAFTHSLCPECVLRLYPEVQLEKELAASSPS